MARDRAGRVNRSFLGLKVLDRRPACRPGRSSRGTGRTWASSRRRRPRPRFGGAVALGYVHWKQTGARHPPRRRHPGRAAGGGSDWRPYGFFVKSNSGMYSSVRSPRRSSGRRAGVAGSSAGRRRVETYPRARCHRANTSESSAQQPGVARCSPGRPIAPAKWSGGNKAPRPVASQNAASPSRMTPVNMVRPSPGSPILSGPRFGLTLPTRNSKLGALKRSARLTEGPPMKVRSLPYTARRRAPSSPGTTAPCPLCGRRDAEILIEAPDPAPRRPRAAVRRRPLPGLPARVHQPPAGRGRPSAGSTRPTTAPTAARARCRRRGRARPSWSRLFGRPCAGAAGRAAVARPGPAPRLRLRRRRRTSGGWPTRAGR